MMGTIFSLGTTEVLCGAAALLTAVQVFTPANPIGSSLRLMKQFRSQVRIKHVMHLHGWMERI